MSTLKEAQRSTLGEPLTLSLSPKPCRGDHQAKICDTWRNLLWGEGTPHSTSFFQCPLRHLTAQSALTASSRDWPFRFLWHRFQNIQQDFVCVDVFGLSFEVGDHAMAQGG